MKGVEEKKLAERILSFYNNYANKSSKVTWNHFKKEEIPRSTVYSYIKRFKDFDEVYFKKKPGRVPTIATSKKLESIKKLLEQIPRLQYKLQLID